MQYNQYYLIFFECLGIFCPHCILKIVCFCLRFPDESNTISAVEGDRLNIKCDYLNAVKINKVQWSKESDDDTVFNPPNVLSKKSQWYIKYTFTRTILVLIKLPGHENRLLIRRFRNGCIYRLRFKNVKHSDHGRYSCFLGGFTETGMFSKWCNFTLITYKRSEATAGGKQLKMTVPQSLSHRKDGAKPKFVDRLYMDNNVVMLVDDVRTLSCPFESKRNITPRRNPVNSKSRVCGYYVQIEIVWIIIFCSCRLFVNLFYIYKN